MFQPVDYEIEYFIEVVADAELPVENQINFYKIVEERYSNLKMSIIEKIVYEIKDWDINLSVEELANKLSLLSLSIPNTKIQPLEWDLTFEPTPDIDANHLCTVKMKDWKIDFITIDG